MALQKKERFVRPSLSVPSLVRTDSEGNPQDLDYKDILWQEPKTLTVLGLSKTRDLLDKGPKHSYQAVTAAQYILCDERANMYEAYIVVNKTLSGYQGQLFGIKTSPE